jgi:hypothetical protein
MGKPRLRRAFYTVLHQIVWRWPFMGGIIFRYACPYPLSEKHFRARHCCRMGECGCNNSDRYPGSERNVTHVP